MVQNPSNWELHKQEELIIIHFQHYKRLFFHSKMRQIQQNRMQMQKIIVTFTLRYHKAQNLVNLFRLNALLHKKTTVVTYILEYHNAIMTSVIFVVNLSILTITLVIKRATQPQALKSFTWQSAICQKSKMNSSNRLVIGRYSDTNLSTRFNTIAMLLILVKLTCLRSCVVLLQNDSISCQSHLNHRVTYFNSKHVGSLLILVSSNIHLKMNVQKVLQYLVIRNVACH